MENIEIKRKEAEDLLKNIQQTARESLKSKKKPELPDKFISDIKNTIDEIINYPENAQLIGILPQYREEFSQFLEIALENLAAEFKRQKILEESIFTDKNKLKLLTEMLIINLEKIAFALAKKLPIPQKILENAKYIATYQDYEFIDKFLNSDEFISQQLNIPIEEVKEIFTQAIKLRFILHNIKDPLNALKRLKDNLNHVLTDENIVKIAMSEGFTKKEAENLKTDPYYKRLFTKSYKLNLALVYKVPVEGVKKFLKGEIG